MVGIATLTTVASRMIIATPSDRKTSATHFLRPVNCGCGSALISTSVVISR